MVGNVEPTYSDKINATLVPGSGIVHDQFVVNARCTNCRKWDQGSLSVDSESQEFIYALGPTWSSIRTDSKSALMQRHIGYGFFTMNLKQAKGDAGVPEGTRTSTGSESSESIHSDYNFVLFAHIVFMVGSFVVLLPLGVLFLRAFQKVKLHSINQNITVVIILIGGGMGIYLSTMFNLTRSFSTGHQILGLILMGLIVVQSVLGFLHHRAYLRTQRRTVVSHAHIWHGRLVILLGILNGFLGLHLAGRSSLDYLLSLIAFAIVYAAIFFFSWSRLRRKRNAYTSPRAANFRDDDPSTFGNSTTDIPLTAHAAPPAYQAEYVPPGAPPGRT
ncbi:hypothetical protein FGG08_006649 [Glutinoglossum americanum]|uniref:Cytochrome b561 domain-containing protein n=1 Tax=Glutinoglossum americanum TaxID=1670608 RepID=A0A9P8I0U0_9PEZI|nr:hypothetical protein FGG08_006649 [Glutinoglossum americanum]